MKKTLSIILCLAAFMGLFACGGAQKAGNELWDEAAPNQSVLSFSRFDETGGTHGWISDIQKEKEILESLSSVNAGPAENWTPEKISFPVYGIEIGTADGLGIMAAWSNGFLIMRDGSTYEFDYDFSSYADKYSWENTRKLDSVSDMPCGRYLAQNGSTWIKEYLAPADELTPPEGISMELVSFSADKAVVSLTNSGSRDWMYGEYYSLDVLLEGVWYTVPVSPDNNWAFTDIGLILPAGKTQEKTCGLAMYGQLPPGTYRIVKENLSAEFSI